ncbi:MAG: LysE family transporter [Gammaproteobacteria bacterium]|jgi:threonine/homoserine/homoserine lactone efflux protein
MEIIIAALSLGITAGLKPGPLGIYVIHQTLLHGARSGLLASLAPFVSDGPIILGSFILVNSFKHFDLFITSISILGALYIAFIAVRLIIATPDTQRPEMAPSSFLTAVKINLLNPVPYIFWSTVGGTYLLQNDVSDAITFALLFLATLSMTKFIMALSIKKLGSNFSDRLITTVLRLLAIFLLFFAIRLFVKALSAA